ncbi:hypothetical protein BO94DRAFT_533097 [Aspergillus sclerotioniger CBS 115572]|uniref:BTB domain-containing protein n=1 Tax=Aspergillus sclerotioniger CBS 115572 TaxID=1450535 RepID=A0A317X4U4_9EURO|nr:hypothetical protein BO94DRAFT_533097 [Aspergillus sclerotioniger CBS 115572]PWY93355.1 hypothetical protein BO94DRAFT_533097 [Aspergillus sclerotioniger CBS 115572]
MDAPQVQVGAPEGPSNGSNAEKENVQTSQNTTSFDLNASAASSAVNEGQADSSHDIVLPDASAADPEPKPAAPKRNPGLQFLDYLRSPIVELVVGTGETKTTLTAHQSLLLASPVLAEKVTTFEGSDPRRIDLPEENVEAFGHFLQFQYTRDYSASQSDSHTEQEAVVGEIDDSGEQLLKHARVYTLAERLGIPSLKTLAHSKIHRINSTSHGEIAYARYVYMNTPVDDVTIRKPVATFWALRSHVLRHEAEEEFRKLCIEVPQFSFDVLSLVLDQKEKRAQDKAESESAVKGSGRKRLRSGL